MKERSKPGALGKTKYYAGVLHTGVMPSTQQRRPTMFLSHSKDSAKGKHMGDNSVKPLGFKSK